MPLTPAKGAKKRITQLKSGDKVPDSEPRRYRNSSGYVRLRWTVAPYKQVEVYEHRVVDGRVTEAAEVHHRNGIKNDNRPENLAQLTSAEHHREHRRHATEPLVELYAQGLSTPAIGRIVGLDAGQVYRLLDEAGVQFRSTSEANRKPTNDALIRYLHGEGCRARAIARQLGVSDTLVRARFEEMGLAPFRTGRPPR